MSVHSEFIIYIFSLFRFIQLMAIISPLYSDNINDIQQIMSELTLSECY